MACMFCKAYLWQLVWRVILRCRILQAKFNRTLENKRAKQKYFVSSTQQNSVPFVQDACPILRDALENAIYFANCLLSKNYLRAEH